MSKNRVLIVGGKGAAMVIAQSIIDANKRGFNDAEFCGFINDKTDDNHIEGYPIMGGIKDIPRLRDEGYVFMSAIHKIGGQLERLALLKQFALSDSDLYTFVHPLAYVAPNVKLGAGSVVLANASISSGTNIGSLTLIMNNVSIGHDNSIGEFCFFTANSCVGSYINFGNAVWIGLNSTILGKLNIGSFSATGAGAVVTKNMGENELWIGNPARFHKSVHGKINM